jgi:5-methylcytosine-specific restriction endonuclease McrA
VTQTAVQRRYVRMAGATNAKARRLGRAGRISSVDLALVYARSEGICCYCGFDLDPESNSFDHVVPFDHGGLNTIDNLVACCLTCQRTKFTKSPAQLEQWRKLQVVCPVDQTVFRPRWADYVRGLGLYCSRRCSGTVGGRT